MAGMRTERRSDRSGQELRHWLQESRMGFMVGSASDGIDKEGVLLTQWMRLGVGRDSGKGGPASLLSCHLGRDPCTPIAVPVCSESVICCPHLDLSPLRNAHVGSVVQPVSLWPLKFFSISPWAVFSAIFAL